MIFLTNTKKIQIYFLKKQNWKIWNFYKIVLISWFDIFNRHFRSLIELSRQKPMESIWKSSQVGKKWQEISMYAVHSKFWRDFFKRILKNFIDSAGFNQCTLNKV